jgi:hypothetical protein
MIYSGNRVFWHNFFGPNSISVDEIFSVVDKKAGERMFFPVVVIEPKN